MPRKKTIDTDEIKLEKIDKQIVEIKDCLQVKIQLNEPFSDEIWNVLQDFYRFQIDKTSMTLTRDIKNSWKGLVMMLLSLAYCKYGRKVSSEVIKCAEQSRIKAKHALRIKIDYLFSTFIKEDEALEIELSVGGIDLEKMLYMGTEAFRKKDEQTQQLYRDTLERFNKQRQYDTRRQKLLERPPDPTFEQIAAPPDWTPYYVQMAYRPEDIAAYISAFSKLLNIDEKRSTVKTEYAKHIPHRYTNNPAVFHKNSVWKELDELKEDAGELQQILEKIIRSE